MSDSNSASFTLSVTGDSTGTHWSGVFKHKLRLSRRDELRMDEIRRELLGVNAQHASERAKYSADLMAQITAYLIEAPAFWTKNNGGMDLEDDNVAEEIYNQIVKNVTEYRERIKAEAEKARKGDLKPSEG